jgi:hypothetical protein
VIATNYARVAEAIKFYKTRGYTYMETPWIVDHDVSAITFPESIGGCMLGTLVGSAEQGFLQLMKQGLLKEGTYVSAGPCFRFGDLGKPGKHPYFFKVELISVGVTDYSYILRAALDFMGGQIVETPQGHDLELHGIEIGSYGCRSHGGMTWAYGTGLAEPRYSEALAKGKK